MSIVIVVILRMALLKHYANGLNQGKTLNKKGAVYVVSAPSGAGKTSLLKAFMIKENARNCRVCVSHTTRAPRFQEIDGQDYFFVSHEKFKEIIADNGFVEYAQVFDQYYGTSKQAIFDIISTGKDVILEIDWQGTRQIKTAFPQCFSIFIMPPSIDVLYQRLIKRNQDTKETVDRRMAEAVKEASYVKEYDYMIINDDFNTALNDLCAIFRAQSLRVDASVINNLNPKK